MKQYRIVGGTPLQGRCVLPAAKNSVLPILAATLLCSETVVLHRVPRTRDVHTSLQLLETLGKTPRRPPRAPLTIAPGPMLCSELPWNLAAAMRSSIFYLAPVLHKTGRVTMPMPGGCRLGPRLIDIHLEGLARMGARITWQPQTVTLTRNGVLHGADYTLRIPSVGATETLLMAAVGAQGASVLRGAACEPEVKDLADFLNRCGADIHGAGTPIIRVRGTPELGGCAFTPLPDRIIGATLACAAASAGGRVELPNARADEMQDILQLLERAGCRVERQNGVCIQAEGRLQGVGKICTGAWPGFATDNAPLLAAAMLRAEGTTEICDTLFEKRFACAAQFAAMGAEVQVKGRTLCIAGRQTLHGAECYAPDLRGGAALVLAALGAQNEPSIVWDAGHIDRGYPCLAAMLRKLGANVRTKTVQGRKIDTHPSIYL